MSRVTRASGHPRPPTSSAFDFRRRRDVAGRGNTAAAAIESAGTGSRARSLARVSPLSFVTRQSYGTTSPAHVRPRLVCRRFVLSLIILLFLFFFLFFFFTKTRRRRTSDRFLFVLSPTRSEIRFGRRLIASGSAQCCSAWNWRPAVSCSPPRLCAACPVVIMRPSIAFYYCSFQVSRNRYYCARRPKTCGVLRGRDGTTLCRGFHLIKKSGTSNPFSLPFLVEELSDHITVEYVLESYTRR